MVDLTKVKSNVLWYTVGYIATDGNLSSSGRHINITSKDTEHLVTLKKALGLTNKLGSKFGSSGTKASVLQFGDVKFYKFLESIGLTQKKSLTLRPLKVPNEYFIDFFRGVIDGDGCIRSWKHPTNGNTQWTLAIVSASPFFLPWLKKLVSAIIKTEGKIYKRNGDEKRNPLYMLRYGKFAAKIILRACYYPGALAMPRKLKSSLECLQSIDGLSKYGKFIST